MFETASLSQFAFGSLTNAIFYPTSYAKVLIQLGHEPLPPVLGKTWFGLGKDRYYLPNLFKYSRYIWRTDGFLGMYNGLLARLIGSNICSLVQMEVHQALKDKERAQENEEDQVVVFLKTFCKQTSHETLARCVGIIVSQPFQVIMVRQMAQFIGHEKQYNGFFAPIYEIYHREGILGFFSGIIPRLIGEVIQIWLSNFIVVLINKYFIQSKEAQTYIAAIFGMVIAQFTYPFFLVSNVMAVSGSELSAASPSKMPFNGWVGCWRHLSSIHQLKRGSSQFFRSVQY